MNDCITDNPASRALKIVRQGYLAAQHRREALRLVMESARAASQITERQRDVIQAAQHIRVAEEHMATCVLEAGADLRANAAHALVAAAKANLGTKVS